MKKTYITDESTAESYALYVGIDTVYGGWIAETGGEPTALNDLEDCGAESEIAAINAIIYDPATPWESLSADDEEYIRSTLERWGL